LRRTYQNAQEIAKRLLLGKEMGLGLIIKLWLKFRSYNLVLWLLGTYGLRESR
jgi:hypothetical protein